MRHSQVEIVPDAPAESWHLSAAGIREARHLASRADWRGVRSIHHSPEPKAAATAAALAAVLGVGTAEAPDLREIRFGGGFLGDAEYERRVGAYLEGAPDPAFEDYRSAQARAVDCVRGLVASARGHVAFVSHGRLLSALFGALGDHPVTAAEWRSLRLPDLCVVDLEAGEVVEGFWKGRTVRAAHLSPGGAGPAPSGPEGRGHG